MLPVLPLPTACAAVALRRLLHTPATHISPGPRCPCPHRRQVAAFTSGRSRVAEYDCLLLRHILWQRPDEADRIYDWLLK